MPLVRFLTLASVTVGTLFSSVGLGQPFVRGPLVMLQVEAPDEFGRFAPVDFGRARQTTANGSLDGLRVFADSATSTDGRDAGTHARQVAEAMVGISSVGGPSVSSLRVMTSADFLSRFLRPTTRNGRITPPARLPGRPQVVNASFSGSTGWNSVDADLLRRADFVIARDRTVMVAGAVTAGSGSFAGASLVWAARNVIAVRGNAPESVFSPDPRTPGRSYPDLWSEGTASLATARVSSAAAWLMDLASQSPRRDLARPTVVRAALLATANRQATPATGDRAWQGTHPTGLDPLWGAGQLDADAAARLLQSPPHTAAPLRSAGRRAPATLRSTLTAADEGLALLTVGGRASIATLFTLTQPARQLTAALTWDATPTTPGGNLRLELHPVNLTPKGQYSLTGEPLVVQGGAGDNVRLLTANLDLDPGTYAWVVRNEGRTPARPALAWTTGLPISVPESLAAQTVGTGPGVAGLPLATGTTSIPEPAATLIALPAATLLVLGPRRHR